MKRVLGVDDVGLAAPQLRTQPNLDAQPWDLSHAESFGMQRRGLGEKKETPFLCGFSCPNSS